MLSRSGSLAVLHHRFHALYTSGAKKCRLNGHLEKLGTRSRRWRLDRIEVRLCRGRFGCPLRFFCVAIVIRDAEGMCNDKCGFVRAHL